MEKEKEKEKKIIITVIYPNVNTTVLKGSITKYPDYESLSAEIIEKSSKKDTFKDVRVSKKDKFILKIDKITIPGLNSVWDSNTYEYFCSKVNQNKIEKVKLIIEKVNKYPEWNPIQYTKILKNSLVSAWNSTRKELEDQLTEHYLNEGKRLFIQEKKEQIENLRDQLLKEIHANIICNNCLSTSFQGERYICSECDNFNLCHYCYNCKDKTRFPHNPQHFFIKLHYPVVIDIQKYNSIFSPSKILLRKKSKEPFEFKVNIINNGENNLQECFISPIRFGKNYLGCLKKTIVNDCNKGDKIELEVLFKFEDDEDEEEDITEYEGYFRLVTKEGIPFGDILYIKLIMEEE